MSNRCYSRREMLALGALAVPAIAGICGCRAIPAWLENDSELVSVEFPAFDTKVSISAACDQATLDSVVSRCRFFDRTLTMFSSTSDVGRINRANGNAVRVNRETARVISQALDYCEESHGLFDVTIGAVSSLWNFKAATVPHSDAVEEALSHVDYRNVLVRDDEVRLLDAGAKIDLGGIAKGFIADDLARMLERAGCESACIDLGGNIKTVGSKPDGSSWVIGIQDPFDSAKLVASLALDDGAAVTSGIYDREFERDGREYWHILDPQTGMPVDTSIESATIISHNSIDGEGLGKPLFMQSPSSGLDAIEKRDGTECLIVSREGDVAQTSGARCQIRC